MRPEIENLKVWMSGRNTTGYQRALAMIEFEKLLSYIKELEKHYQPPISEKNKHLSCKNCVDWEQGNNPNMYCLVCNRMVEFSQNGPH